MCNMLTGGMHGCCRYPKDIGLKRDGPSPWLKLFQNAREWCCSTGVSK